MAFPNYKTILQKLNSLPATIYDLKGVIQMVLDRTQTNNIELTGDVQGKEVNGVVPTTISNSGVTAGSYTAANISVGADGRITAASNGSGGSGTVTSIGLSAGTGISVGGTNPVTTSGTISVTNTAPDQTVVLNNGTGIAVTGTYPNFTIANTAPSTVTPAALTKTDDTNVTATLTGTASTSLLQAVNIALGWTGTLADSRLSTTEVTPSSYGSSTQVATFTVGATGRLTAASNVTITPAVSSLTGLGTGVASSLAVNVGTTGSFVVNDGALGTPASGNLANCTFPALPYIKRSYFYFSNASYNPPDTTPFYFGGFPSVAPSTTAALRRIYFSAVDSVLITECNFVIVTNSVGSNESIAFAIRVNNTTDYALSSSSITATTTVIPNTSLNSGAGITVPAGQYIEIKATPPVFATNPTGVFFTGTLVVQ